MSEKKRLVLTQDEIHMARDAVRYSYQIATQADESTKKAYRLLLHKINYKAQPIAPRYWLYANASYYPEGGQHDFVGRFETIQDAITAMASLTGNDWWHVVDSETAKIVYSQRGPVE